MTSVFFVIFAISNQIKMSIQLKEKVYLLKGGKEPLAFVLQSRNSRRSPLLHFDEEKGINRALRFARNQRSPFQDEQDESAIVEPIIFENGVLRVSKTDTTLQEFLKYHPGNGRIFEEFSPERNAEIDIEELNYEVDALIAAREMGIDKCEEILREIIGNRVDNMTSKEVRRDILVYARNNAYEFLLVAGDPNVKMKNDIAKMFEVNIINFRNKGKDVYFNLPTNKKRMMTILEGEDKEKAVFEFFKSEEGEPIYNKLYREL
jgi:hypothetical protein